MKHYFSIKKIKVAHDPANCFSGDSFAYFRMIDSARAHPSSIALFISTIK
jgi:hypothetical protein